MYFFATVYIKVDHLYIKVSHVYIKVDLKRSQLINADQVRQRLTTTEVDIVRPSEPTSFHPYRRYIIRPPQPG